MSSDHRVFVSAAYACATVDLPSPEYPQKPTTPCVVATALAWSTS